MSICYKLESPSVFFKKSIYLAGPDVQETDKSKSKDNDDNASWKSEAIKILKEEKFTDSVIFMPHNRKASDNSANTEKSINWEKKWLNAADAVIFWFPDNDANHDDISDAELNEYFNTWKIFVGSPAEPTENDKNMYLKMTIEESGGKWYTDLRTLIKDALAFIGEGSTRRGAERKVPINIWNDRTFQKWKDGIENNNLNCEITDYTINHAIVDSVTKELFCWIIKPSIHIGKEKRDKNNEVVIGRLAGSIICVYTKDTKLDDTRFVLVKEFRSAVKNKDGYVLELPSGALHEGESIIESSLSELQEETGVVLQDKDFKKVGDRQFAPTLIANTSFVYKIGITSSEMDAIEKEVKDKTFGIQEETEITYVCIKTWKQILSEKQVDWSTLGILTQAMLGDE